MILYKYVRPQHLESTLRFGTFAFPLISQLNDPFESSADAVFKEVGYQTVNHAAPPIARKPVLKMRFGNYEMDAINPIYDEYYGPDAHKGFPQTTPDPADVSHNEEVKTI